MQTVLRIDTSDFNRAFAAYRKTSKRDLGTLLIEQAKGFLRRVIALTPPAQGKADSTAKKRGEAVIAADLARIFTAAAPEFIDRFIDFHGGREAKEDFGHKGAAALGFIYTKALSRDEMTDWHLSRRRKDGRVMQVNRSVTTGLRKRDLKGLDTGLVEDRAFEWFKKRVQARVGILAGGWNKAAKTVGYNPPQWIRRQGDGRGDIDIELSGERMKIVIKNDVQYASTVKGMEGRINRALRGQAAAMKRRTEYFLKRNASRSGFRAR